MTAYKPKIWQQVRGKEQLAAELASGLNISSLTAKILVNRGVQSVSDGKKFIESDATKLSSPFLLSGMEQGVARLKKALNKNEKIIVYGDYDVDGITGTALIYEMLQRIGAKVAYYIPERMEEGYGLNCRAISEFNDQGVNLIITVDCGISSAAEVAMAANLGIDVIITDHHEPPVELPAALAVINPKLDKGKAFEHLAGVGVAFKFAQAVHLTYKLPLYHQIAGGEYLDLVALGTIADMVPIVDENRVLVKWGLKFIQATWRPGLKALVEESGLWNKELDTGDVGFGLAPRINAAGRVSSPLTALELLITEEPTRGEQLAKLLSEENKKRQLVEQEIHLEAERLIEENIDLDVEKVIVLASEKWHAGVIGIVASKIVEKYYRPTILIALENGEGKGSGRSIAGLDLYQALDNCRDLLIKFGGHMQAAGLSIATEKIIIFRQAINDYANRVLTDDDLNPVVKIDTQVDLQELTMTLAEELELLSPFGLGNPRPVLSCSNANIVNWSKVGKDQNHLKVKVAQENTSHNGIGFNLAPYDKLVAATQSVSLAFGLEKNIWQGQEQLQIILKDLKPYYLNPEKIQVPTGFNLLDARQIKNIKRYLHNFSGENNLVYVYNYEDKQEIESWLAGDNKQYWDFFIANGFPSQLNKKSFTNIFLLQIPLHWEDAQKLASLSSTLHLSYAKFPDNNMVTQKFPDRDIIGKVYLILKDVLGNTKKKLSYRELFGVIYRSLNLTPEDSMIPLQVLSEISLLVFKVGAGQQEFELELLQEPKEKLDLYTSETYNKLMNQKGSFLYWASFWLYGAKTDIQNNIFRGE